LKTAAERRKHYHPETKRERKRERKGAGAPTVDSSQPQRLLFSFYLYHRSRTSKYAEGGEESLKFIGAVYASGAGIKGRVPGRLLYFDRVDYAASGESV
jgi:hypothetical protein